MSPVYSSFHVTCLFFLPRHLPNEVFVISDEPRVQGKKERNEGKDIWQGSSQVKGKMELSKSQDCQPKSHGFAELHAHGDAEQREHVDHAQAQHAANQKL